MRVLLNTRSHRIILLGVDSQIEICNVEKFEAILSIFSTLIRRELAGVVRRLQRASFGTAVVVDFGLLAALEVRS